MAMGCLRTWDLDPQVRRDRVMRAFPLLRCNGTLCPPPRYRPRPAMTARRARRSVDALPKRTAMTSHADSPRQFDDGSTPGNPAFDAGLSQHDGRNWLMPYS